jgi:hypothetical protein
VAMEALSSTGALPPACPSSPTGVPMEAHPAGMRSHRCRHGPAWVRRRASPAHGSGATRGSWPCMGAPVRFARARERGNPRGHAPAWPRSWAPPVGRRSEPAWESRPMDEEERPSRRREGLKGDGHSGPWARGRGHMEPEWRPRGGGDGLDRRAAAGVSRGGRRKREVSLDRSLRVRRVAPLSRIGEGREPS